MLKGAKVKHRGFLLPIKDFYGDINTRKITLGDVCLTVTALHVTW